MAEFDRYATEYNALLDDALAPLGGFSDYYLRRKVEVVRKSLLKTGVRSVLDFGCGQGGTTLMLQMAFADARVVGIDVSEQSIEEARRRNPGIEFACMADDVFLASCSGMFDLVYVANVFHHVPPLERSAVLNTLKRTLAPNGKVFFFEHNPYNPLTRWAVSRCTFDQDAILITPRESRSLFLEAGFNVDRTIFLLFFPSALKLLSKMETSLEWLPLGAQYCLAASL